VDKVGVGLNHCNYAIYGYYDTDTGTYSYQADALSRKWRYFGSEDVTLYYYVPDLSTLTPISYDYVNYSGIYNLEVPSYYDCGYKVVDCPYPDYVPLPPYTPPTPMFKIQENTYPTSIINGKTGMSDLDVMGQYDIAFTSLPEILKRNILYVMYWSGAEWLKNKITLDKYGKAVHSMACADWGHAVNGKSPIYIDLGKPAKPSTEQFNFYSVAAHEAGHALDTCNKTYSNTAQWINITNKYGAKIYSIDAKTTYEVFAAAVAWSVTNPNKLKSISMDAYNYIDNIFKKG